MRTSRPHRGRALALAAACLLVAQPATAAPEPPVAPRCARSVSHLDHR
ncbi:hypothetical protein AB0H12_41320 [Actinosynnema sp. NPDC023794]